MEERFCTHCGQENIPSRQPFYYLFTHFFEDLTHYDGKVWKTFRSLLLHPGRLTKEYLKGRRRQYVAPVRLYIFMSFVAFLLPALLPSKNESVNIRVGKTKSAQKMIEKLEDRKKEFADQAKNSNGVISDKTVAAFNRDMDKAIADIENDRKAKHDSAEMDGLMIFGDNYSKNIRSVEQFDSLQKALPEKKKYGWLVSTLKRKEF